MQKHSLTPDQKLRKAMYDPLPVCEADEKTVSVLGSDFVLDESSDIKRLLKRYGYRVRELPACNTWQELLEMSKGRLFINCYPAGKYGMEAQARRLGREHLYLPGSFSYEEIGTAVKAADGCARIAGIDGMTSWRMNVRPVRKSLQRARESDGGDTDCPGLSLPSKTTGTGKTASDTWFLCESSLSGQYQPGRERGVLSGLRSMHRNWN